MSKRGFDGAEYEGRCKRAQSRMAAAGLGALLLTKEADIRYFTGFLTRFFESPTRPWFVIIPASGAPIAVIPSIGAELMGRTWINDVRTWAAPNPEDDGVSLLAETLREISAGLPVGVPSGLETHLRMPLASFQQVQSLSGLRFTHGHRIVASLRQIKSEAEITKIRAACDVAARSFARVHEIAQIGASLAQVFRRFQGLLLEEGADWVPYLAGGAGPLGYRDVISPAEDTPLALGDILMLDTGAMVDGYFCDYDRNFAIGSAGGAARGAHAKLLEATNAGLEAAQVGVRACDVAAAMGAVVGGTEAGRLGHGLGMELTEGLSLIRADTTELAAGMVITLEPAIETSGGNILVHEEVVVIREGGAEALSPWASGALPVI